MTALDIFIRFSDQIIEFDANFSEVGSSEQNKFSLEVFRQELCDIWLKTKNSYEKCLRFIEEQEDSEDVEVVKAKYTTTFRTYVFCLSKINELLHQQPLFAPSPDRLTLPPKNEELTNNLRLPPCDMEVFKGNYLSWPTFRDMFTALYINNSRLSDVERLYHLVNKTSGDAKEIVQKAPLTNGGFLLAWQNLKDTYENKRILVNNQLKLLFDLPVVSTENAAALKNLQRGINNCLSVLKLYDISTLSWDPILIFLCCQRLPDNTLSLWEQSLKNKTLIPKWSALDEFLTDRHQTLDSILDIKGNSFTKTPTKVQNTSQGQTIHKKLNAYHTNVSVSSCILCPKQQHYLRSCPKFLKLSITDRYLSIKKFNCCLNCLTKNHSVKDCRSIFSCSVCKKRHHTLLHKNNFDELPSTSGSPHSAVTSINRNQPEIVSQTFHHLQSTSQNSCLSNELLCSTSRSSTVILGTATVLICHLGVSYEARALIDSASEASFISERLQNMLKLPSSRTQAKISGINQKISANPSQLCSFVLSSTLDSNLNIEATALVLPQITSNLPSVSIDFAVEHHMPNVQLADANFLKSGPVDVLIGGDLYPLVMLDGVKRNFLGGLIAQETVFGWIVTGSLSSNNVSCFATKVTFSDEIAIDKQIQRFWELEEIPKKKFITEADKFCEQYYVQTTTRNCDGRYVVSLPFKEILPSEIKLGNSRHIAYKQFIKNENSLLKKTAIKSVYDNVVKEYLHLNHMEKVESPNFCHFPNHCYLPHHAVIKPDSRTTALRVVFNASSSTSNGYSLNDILHVGPVLQADLTFLILRWRFFRYVFNSDIQKMYRQILVHPLHRPFQRILFRENPSAKISDFELKTVTFGVNCAPFLAIRTLLQLASDVQDIYPLAAFILKSCMYVDDVLTGAHDINMALKARDELIHALNSAGFSLQKWTANHKDILENLPKEHLLDTEFLEFDETSNAKALGVRWNARNDYFYFRTIPIKTKEGFTKRDILSTTAKLFDPAGWLAPIIVVAKIIMQQVWLDQTGWDEVVSSLTLAKWENFVEKYHFINQIKVNRWISYTPESLVQVHAFSDASEKAYAGAIYIRINNNSNISTFLLMAKTKVAPVKSVSLPRLELCGALLLSEMLDSLLAELPIKIEEIFCWTDSTIVLSWLQKPPCAWTCFVANRISKIQERVDSKKWHHIDSHDNPADLGSRGISPQDLANNSLWWHGPSWLKNDYSLWPHSQNSVTETTLEARAVKSQACFFSNYEDILLKFSSLPRAYRVLSYVFRFFYRTHSRFRNKYSYSSLMITGTEISNIKTRLIIICQKVHFADEYQNISHNHLINSKSTILTLNPYMDSNGILRVNGRLINSPLLSFNEKHPILIPYNCRFTDLLVQFMHQISLHGANALLLRLIRQQYWIPKAKNLVKTIIHKCKICVLAKKKQHSQIMAALPVERTILSRPFETTGLDFAGPIDVKNYTGRACLITKGYVCVFICFSTKAIHLEATSDLSATTFLAAFSRFASRRGCPKKLFSDNGTNFVGASKIIKKDFSDFIKSSQEKIYSNYCDQDIIWNFIPAGAPHMGGLWEAGVKSFKVHFKKMAISQKYTFEELSTLLCRIEACLNSRPLSPSSNNISDLAALTPGHFLIGGPILAPAEPSFSGHSLSFINRWQKLKAFAQNLSLRWKEEYLKELHKRFKWKYPEKSISVNDLVVVKQENLPTTEWRLGRVIRVYQGPDKRVRVADIKTQKGVITRSIVKLIVLPD